MNIDNLTNSELERLYKIIGDKLNVNKQFFNSEEFRSLEKEYCDLHDFDNKEMIKVSLTMELEVKPYIESIFKNSEERIDFNCSNIDQILSNIPEVKLKLNQLRNDREELDSKIKSFAEKCNLTFNEVESKLWDNFISKD
jgi:ABC-type methionine transport system ATPase subunit